MTSCVQKVWQLQILHSLLETSYRTFLSFSVGFVGSTPKSTPKIGLNDIFLTTVLMHDWSLFTKWHYCFIIWASWQTRSKDRLHWQNSSTIFTQAGLLGYSTSNFAVSSTKWSPNKKVLSTFLYNSYKGMDLSVEESVSLQTGVTSVSYRLY